MPKSTIEIQRWNAGSKNRENRLKDIYFLTKEIPRVSYYDLKVISKYPNASQEELLEYCELLYKFVIEHDEMEVLVKSKSFSESDSILSLVAFLEDLILSNHLTIFEVDLKNSLVRIESVLPVFNDYSMFDMNVGYLDFKLDENLKIGITQCVNKINICDSGGLFDHQEMEWILGEFYEEEENFTKKEVDSFNKTLVKYHNKFHKYLLKNYNSQKKYTSSFEIYIAGLINDILAYDTTIIHEHAIERYDGEMPFSTLFMPVLREVTEISERIFEEMIETRCRSLGEVNVESLSQFFEITKDSIKQVVSDEEIKKMEVYEKNIDQLAYLTNNYEDAQKERA